MKGYRRLADLQELEEGTPLGRGDVVLVRIGEDCYAFENSCPHQAWKLEHSTVCCEERTVTCPLHEWAFRLSDGECVRGGVATLDVYPTRVVEGEVWVKTERT